MGLDLSPDMLAEAERQGAAGIGNVRWRQLAAEDISQALGSCRLATLGNTLARSRFSRVETGEYRWSRVVDADTIIGELHSTSFASRALLGAGADAFEAELRQALVGLDPAGRFVQRLRTESLLARRP